MCELNHTARNKLGRQEQGWPQDPPVPGYALSLFSSSIRLPLSLSRAAPSSIQLYTE